MNKTLKKEIERTFLQTIKDLRGEKEIEVFLKALMGEVNYEKLYKKLAIAYWLKKKRSHDIIKTNLDVSGNEIQEVEQLMNKKGIKLALKYMEAEEFANVWSEKFKNFTFKK